MIDLVVGSFLLALLPVVLNVCVRILSISLPPPTSEASHASIQE